MADVTMERILKWKLIPRIMMLTMTIVWIRCIEFGLSAETLSTQHSALISVVSGATTGSFAAWLNSEKDVK
jgi:hypothetical protein